MSVSIREMRPDDCVALVSLWQTTMPADPIDEQRLLADFLLDSHFDPQAVLIAADGATDVGFVFGMRARAELPSDNAPGTGIVLGFGVLPEFRRRGIGTQLVQHLEARWRDAGVNRIQIGPWIPTYLTPGVDEQAYPAAVPFLQSLGVEGGAQPVSMRALLTGYTPAPDVAAIQARLAQAGTTIRAATVADTIPLVAFARQHFPYWESYVQDTLRALFVANAASTIIVARRDDSVIGFALANGERFGPFGVDESCRGQGVGAVLLSHALCAMRARNIHLAYFLWTSDRTARLYHRHGFEIVRRFTMMTKNYGDSIQ